MGKEPYRRKKSFAKFRAAVYRAKEPRAFCAARRLNVRQEIRRSAPQMKKEILKAMPDPSWKEFVCLVAPAHMSTP
jgi:hypothetical protein